jgi:hypothetical protein
MATARQLDDMLKVLHLSAAGAVVAAASVGSS